MQRVEEERGLEYAQDMERMGNRREHSWNDTD